MKHTDIFYWLICPALLLSYLLEPLFGDIYIYAGAAKVAVLTGVFPLNIDAIWESRFITHRLLYYILEIIVPFSDPVYSIIIKSILAIPTILILYYFSKQISKHMQIQIQYPFIIGFLGLFAVNNFVILSSESLSVIISMLMISLLLDTTKYHHVAAALLILPLITIKGLPVLLVPIAFLVMMLLLPNDYKKRISSITIGISIVIISGLCMLIYFPHMVSDYLLISKLYYIGNFDISQNTIRFFNQGINLIGYIPIIIIGFTNIFLIITKATKNNRRDICLLMLMWAISAIYVIIILEFYTYHYYLMLIPSILTICYFLKYNDHSEQILCIIFIVTIVLYASFVSSWSFGLNGANYRTHNTRVNSANDINAQYDIINQPITLYYDYGYGGYYFPTQSACRFVGPLPYQRHMPEWDMRGTQEYWETLNCTLNYNGKYIIVDPLWINLSVSTHSELSNKLNTEYTKVYTNLWDIYQHKGTTPQKPDR